MNQFEFKIRSVINRLGSLLKFITMMASSCAKPQNNNIKNNNEKHRGMYGKDYK